MTRVSWRNRSLSTNLQQVLQPVQKAAGLQTQSAVYKTLLSHLLSYFRSCFREDRPAHSQPIRTWTGGVGEPYLRGVGGYYRFNKLLPHFSNAKTGVIC